MVEIDSMEIEYLRGTPKEARGTAAINGQPCAVRAWHVPIHPGGWFVLAPCFATNFDQKQNGYNPTLENFLAQQELKETFSRAVIQAAETTLLFNEEVKLFQRYPVLSLALMRMASFNP